MISVEGRGEMNWKLLGIAPERSPAVKKAYEAYKEGSCHYESFSARVAEEVFGLKVKKDNSGKLYIDPDQKLLVLRYRLNGTGLWRTSSLMKVPRST